MSPRGTKLSRSLDIERLQLLGGERNELAAAVFVSFDDGRFCDLLARPRVVWTQRDPGGLIRSLGGSAAARVSGAGPQAGHRRQRGGTRALDLSPLCRTRLGAVLEGGARRPGTEQQVVDECCGSSYRRQAVLARGALPRYRTFESGSLQ